RHIGYAQIEVPVVGDTVRVELQRIAVSLAGVQVNADRRCVDPARPDPAATDPASVVVNQLVENGRQYELVTTKYPFLERMDQRFGYLDAHSSAVQTAERIDLIVSDRVWRYRPGRVIEETALGRSVNVPTIAVFAQEDFLRTHCFWLASSGADSSADATTALRIEFRAASRITDPDLDGTIYLDPKSFAIRRALLRVSNLARYSDEFDSVTVNTEFTELYPGVPIVTAIDGYNHYSAPVTRDGKARLALLERQRVVSIDFSKGPPGETSGGKKSRFQLLLDRIVGVYDDSTGKPISGAVLFDTLSRQETKTTGTGTSRLAFVLNDRAVLRISAPGYATEMVPVELSLKPLPPVTIVLHSASVPKP
ncbi:MAG TPA: carboxypeptidase-like regulatory domain-containing protein, partial [Gemmatimonadaceae bacterium]